MNWKINKFRDISWRWEVTSSRWRTQVDCSMRRVVQQPQRLGLQAMNDVLLHGTTRADDDADRSRRRDVTSATGWMTACRYRGAVPWRQLNTRTHMLRILFTNYGFVNNTGNNSVTSRCRIMVYLSMIRLNWPELIKYHLAIKVFSNAVWNVDKIGNRSVFIRIIPYFGGEK